MYDRIRLQNDVSECLLNPNKPLLGEDPYFLEVIEHISRLAPLDKSALVIGERGSGKELIAERLHYLSERWDGPLVKVNCAALTQGVLDSELFGHESGAFTGAKNRHLGRFERAHGGTLILDEIATASLTTQEKILRVLEYGELDRVGGNETLQVDVRVVGVANVDLPALAAKGLFREDLLDRLAFDVVNVPPLRVRQGDILLLARAFATEMAMSLDLYGFEGFSEHAEQQLLQHAWPGNVRELKNVVERSVYRHGMGDGEVADIQFDPFQCPWQSSVNTSPQENDGASAHALPEQGFREAVDAYERDLLSRALRQNQYNQSQSAKLLKLDYQQFRRLLKKHQLP